MTNRERFFKTMRFEPVDHPPLSIGGGWWETQQRWQQEGMPEDVDLHEYFEVEPQGLTNVSPETRIFPSFEEEILEEDDKYVILRTHRGSIVKRCKGMEKSGAEHYLEYPIKGPQDKEWLAERLDPDNPGRFENGWDERLAENRGHPHNLTLVDFGSFFGDLHERMGTAQIAVAYYDFPEFIHWYNDRIASICERVANTVLPLGGVDFMGGHEDMAYKGASLISPEMFREFMSPYYRRTVGAAKKYGQWIFYMDSDGDVTGLIPLWLEVGVNLTSPCEVAAGVEVGQLRAEYGQDLLMVGGIDKRALAAGKQAIKREVDQRARTAELGGYIPSVDHGIPPDVSWENYCYFVQTMKEAYGMA